MQPPSVGGCASTGFDECISLARMRCASQNLSFILPKSPVIMTFDI
ncbi:hypothetical protein [uncultured Helicobacter sp.]|nr:hypothetical protein [Candidatus Helicobacter avicola]